MEKCRCSYVEERENDFCNDDMTIVYTYNNNKRMKITT